MYLQYFVPLLLAMTVLADYYVDNANSSVIYSMAPSQSGQAWQTFSSTTQSLELQLSNSTGNYTIPLNSSYCYDQNYALGVCGVGDNCFVEIPFIGSGITMYVFNAGFSGMTASFAIDGGNAVTNSIDAPPAPTYQVSNVSLYNVQGLTSGNHTMVMTILDWNGSPTSMKFDYAYVNETLVAASATSSVGSTSASSPAPSQMSTNNSSTSNGTHIGAILGGTLGGAVVLAVIGVFYLRKRKARRPSTPSPNPAFEINPFMSEYRNSPTPPQRTLFTRNSTAKSSVTPIVRSAIPRDAFVAATQIAPATSSELIQSSESIRSGRDSPALVPLRRPRSSVHADQPMSLSDVGSPFSDPRSSGRHSLTVEQLGVIDQLRRDKVPTETIAQVIGFVTSRNSESESGSASVMHNESIASALPPSYETRDHYS